MATIPGLRTYDPATANAPVQAGTDVQSAEDLSQNFLRMLTVQLRNQDPLNPMDNAAMTAQLAQLNMVDGINKLNTSVGAMMAQLKAATQLNMGGSIGRSVLSEGSKMYFTGQPVGMAVELSTNADALEAVLRNVQGQEVDRMVLGPASAGVTDFIWDGKDAQGQALPEGVYTLDLQARNGQGENLPLKSYVSAMVASIGLDDEVMTLGLHDGRRITADDIFKWVAV